MATHAELSPSSAARWSVCTASVAAQRGIKDDGNDAARWGTAAHLVASEALESGKQAQEYHGRIVAFGITAEGRRLEDFVGSFSESRLLELTITHQVVVDDEIVDCAHSYVQFVRELAEVTGAQMLIEQRVSIGHITGELDAGGTADTILLTDDEITVIDLKGGMGKVLAYQTLSIAHKDLITGIDKPAVYEPNKQLAMYAGGALREHRLMHDFKRVTTIIVQPRLNHVSQYTMSVEALEGFLVGLSAAAERTRTDPVFAPSFDACHFCKAKGNCSAQTDAVLSAALTGFEDVNEAVTKVVSVNSLGSMYSLLPMIVDWCAAIRERTYDELVQGRPVVRNDGLAYKLVTGRQGNREWADLAEAEAALKKMRLKPDQMYVSKVIGPATAEKFTKPPKVKAGEVAAKPLLGKTQWNKLLTLIHQKEGAPAIALETDPRPAVAPATSGFDDVSPVVEPSGEDLFK